MYENDINFLKKRLYEYLEKEKYERAEVLKNWIIDLGGDPKIYDSQVSINSKIEKNGR